MTVDTVSTSLITVDYGNSLQAMIAAGKYEWVSSNSQLDLGAGCAKSPASELLRWRFFAIARGILHYSFGYSIRKRLDDVLELKPTTLKRQAK